MLHVIDGQWKDHLLSMDHLKEGIGLRGYGQRDPLVEYKKESFTLFEDLMSRVEDDTIRFLFLLQPVDEKKQAEEALRHASDKLVQATQAASLAELSASIAHEVNQPLAAIVANSHACQRWLSAEPPNVVRAKITAERITREAAGYHLPAGDLAKSAAILERLAEEVPPGGARADALLLLASSQQTFERSLELAERALVEAHGDDARVAKIECYIGEILLLQGAAEQALEHARAGLAFAEQAGDENVLALALSTVAWFETLSAVAPTPELLERAVALEDARPRPEAPEASDATSPGFALSMLLMFAGRLEEARERMGVSLATAKRWVDRASRDVSALVEADPELSARLGGRGGFHAPG